MKLFEKIKLFFKDNSSIKTEKFISAQQSCPHCASRGLFIFKSTSKILTTMNKVGLKTQCQSESS